MFTKYRIIYETALIVGMLLSVVACDSDEVLIDRQGSREIEFSCRTTNVSRAAHSYCANDVPERFCVWAWLNDSSNEKTLYINGDEVVTPDGGISWKNESGQRFWPEGDGLSLSFYAFVDADNTFRSNDGKPIFEGFSVKDDVAGQLDLMYAVCKDATYSQGMARLNFRHALSQVCFRAKNENHNIRITVNSITIGNLYNSGDYTFPSESTTTNYTEHSDNPGVVPVLNKGEWILSGTPDNSYSVEFGVSLDGKTSKSVNLSSPLENHSNGYAKVMTLMPQKVEACAPGLTAKPDAGAYFILNLTVDNVVRGADEDGGDRYVRVMEEKDFYVPVDVDWSEGVRYIYNFNFTEDWSPFGTTPINYTVSFDDYVPQDGGDLKGGMINGHQGILMRKNPALYVAECNLGAENPEEAGNYYWWSGTMGKEVRNFTNLSAVVDFSFNIQNADCAAYNKSEQELVEDGIITSVGETGILSPYYDAAYCEWGGHWRVPTKEDMEWLTDSNNCDWVWRVASEGECAGYWVISKSTTNRIFIPAGGSCTDDKLYNPNVNGNYWLSTKYGATYGAWSLRIEASIKNLSSSYVYYGFNIRPVAK